MKLNVRAFALAFAIWWGVGICALTWWVWAEALDRTLPAARLSAAPWRNWSQLQLSFAAQNHDPNQPGRTANFRAQIRRSQYKSLTPQPPTSAPNIRDAGTCKSLTYAIQNPSLRPNISVTSQLDRATMRR